MPKPRAIGSKRKVFDLWKQGLTAQQIFDDHCQKWPEKDRPLWDSVRAWVRGWERARTGEYDGHGAESIEEKRATDWHLETTNENDTNETPLFAAARTHLFNCILDFANAALLIEREIRCHGLRDNSQDVVPKSNGRIHQDMWASMKSVSHFNLGIALELLLKLLLKLNDKGYEHIHGLAKLLEALPSPVQERLEITYQDCRSVLPDGYELVAFITKPPPVPSSPPNHDLETLKDFFEYFDEDVRLSTKRYSHELIEEEKWRHYLKDLSVFIELIDRVMGNLGKYIASEDGPEHERN